MIIPCKIDKGRYRKFGRKYNGLYHLGHDFDCPLNTPIYACADGKVIISAQINGFGGYNPSKKGGVVWIKHDSVYALYGHLKYIVHKDDIVKEGDLIGYISHYYSNKVDLPHLHFGIYLGNSIPKKNLGYADKIGNWTDPLKYIKS